MAERKRWSWVTILFITVFLLLIGSIGYMVWTLGQDMQTELEEMIGLVYREDPDAAERVMADLFEKESEDSGQLNGEYTSAGDTSGRQAEEKLVSGDLPDGKGALVELGYTRDGMEYLMEYNGMQQRMQILIYSTVILGGIMTALYFVLVRGQERREQELADEIRGVRTAQQRKERSGAGSDDTGQTYGKNNNEEADVLLLTSASQGLPESELVKLTEEMQARETYFQNKNVMIQNFIENISHQIRTPLSCIAVSQDMLLESGNNEQRELAGQSLRYVEEIQELLRKILDIGRMEAGKVIWHREKFIIGELLEECRISLEDGPERIETEGDLQAEYYGDYEWLKEAFSNIMKNCLEHDQGPEKIRVSVTSVDEGIKVVIRDHGPGFHPEDIPHIFDRFYLPERMKKSHVGIGLNLAKLVFEHHFGSVSAVNHEEGGAVFTVILPVYQVMTEKI